jgi:hypothetical protein
MVQTLREHETAREVVEKEAVAGLSEGSLEREPREDLVASYTAAKIEQDEQIAPQAAKSEAPVGADFAKAVETATAAAKPTAAKRRFLPQGVVERLRSAIVGEFAQALRFRRATSEASREYLESVQDHILFEAPSAAGAATGGSVVDGALSQLRKRLSTLRTFSGEGMQERLTAKETQVRQLLEAELATSTGLLKDSDIEALAEKLRSSIDQRYWWRFVVGPAELAVAGAVGGYFAFWKGAGTAVKFGPRIAAAAAKKVARTALMRTARAHMPAMHLPGLSTPDEMAVHNSMLATIGRAAWERGTRLTRSESMQVAIKLAKQNGIAVKAWGIAGRIKDTNMPDGMVLRGVHEAIRQVLAHA